MVPLNDEEDKKESDGDLETSFVESESSEFSNLPENLKAGNAQGEQVILSPDSLHKRSNNSISEERKIGTGGGRLETLRPNSLSVAITR